MRIEEIDPIGDKSLENHEDQITRQVIKNKGTAASAFR